jgi:hypothetical protein
MFERESSLGELAIASDGVLKLLMSLNSPAVALEDQATDEADAMICTVRRDSDMVSTYVYLCLHGSGEGVFYRYEADPYPEDLRDEVEAQALSFAESLGFIMDDTHFSDLAPDDRKELLERGPFSEAPWEALPEQPQSPAQQAAPGGAQDLAEDGEAPADPGPTQDEVAAALRAVTSPVPAAETAGAGEPAAPPPAGEEPDFERAIREFIEDSQEEPPVETPSEPAPLSRFKMRAPESDIYAIRGRAEEADAPEAAARAPAEEPVVEPALPGPIGPEGADPATRARRAKARYLASF